MSRNSASGANMALGEIHPEYNTLEQPLALTINAERRLLSASDAARRFLAQDRRISDRLGYLSGSTLSAGARIEAAIRTAMRHSGAAGRILLGDGADALRIDIVALNSETQTGQFLVLISDPQMANRSRVDAAIRKFELTPSETRLLRSLSEGRTVPQAAACLGVAYSTARTHLQRVFDKTGVRRQADLIRLLERGSHPAFAG